MPKFTVNQASIIAPNGEEFLKFNVGSSEKSFKFFERDFKKSIQKLKEKYGTSYMFYDVDLDSIAFDQLAVFNKEIEARDYCNLMIFKAINSRQFKVLNSRYKS